VTVESSGEITFLDTERADLYSCFRNASSSNCDNNTANSNSLENEVSDVNSLSSDEYEDCDSDDLSDEYEGCGSDISGSSDESEGCESDTNSSDQKENSQGNISNSENQPTQLQELCVLSYARRFNLSKEATQNLIKLISVLCPNMNINHSSLMTDNDDVDCKCMHYCEKCNAVFPDDPEAFICGTAGCHGRRYKGNNAAQKQQNRQPKCSFVIANMEFQLKQILERSNNWELIQEMKRWSINAVSASSDGCIHDIIDGKLYKKLCEPGQFLNQNTNISALMNTDGIPLYSSSKVKLWPIFLAINELPPSHRFSRNNLILAGIWQGKGNPPFLHYMYSFACSIEKLYYEGFAITPPNSSKVTVRLSVICASVDLQAKAYIANMSMHNGEYGCSTCEEPGKVVKKGKGHVRSYAYHPPQERPMIRNPADIERAARKATPQKRIKGICGVSGLSALPNFDLVNGLVPDYMHGVLLGVTKYLMQLWFSSSNSSKPFFIGKHLDEISSKIQKMTPPDCVERLPRNLEKHYLNYKATEFQTWLLYYSIPCLKGILPDVYLEHFCHFSESVFLLLGDNIARADINRASDLLEKFYHNFQNLYGLECCTLNVHNVGAHLADFVDKWGPLWAWSCFPFEDSNAAILQAVNGTGDVTKQYIHTKHLEMKLNAMDISNYTENSNEKSFLRQMRQKSRCWTSMKSMKNCNVAGKLVSLSKELTPNDFLKSINTEKLSEVRKCLRIELHGQKYYSEEYSRMKKRVCFFVVNKLGEIFAIRYFVVNKVKEVFAVAKKYVLEENCFIFESSGRHIFKVKEIDGNILQTFPVDMIKEKAFYISLGDKTCVSLLPNVVGHGVLK